MGVLDDSGRPIIDPDRELKTPQQAASTSVFARDQCPACRRSAVST